MDYLDTLDFELNYAHANLTIKLIGAPIAYPEGYWMGVSTVGDHPWVYSSGTHGESDTTFHFRVCDGEWDINPIYFELNSAEIQEEAAIELQKVVRVLNKYPDLKIDFGSHTDSRATDKYNWDLSNRRAKATRKWIIDRGISGERISGKYFMTLSSELSFLNASLSDFFQSHLDENLF